MAIWTQEQIESPDRKTLKQLAEMAQVSRRTLLRALTGRGATEGPACKRAEALLVREGFLQEPQVVTIPLRPWT